MDDERYIGVSLAAMRVAERGLGALVDGVSADDVALADALALWRAFDRVERLAAGAKLLLAARVEESGDWKRAGARSAAEHLARMSGVTTGVARRMLVASAQIGELALVGDALRAGSVSAVQAEAIAAAATADPAAEQRLLDLAATTSVHELREECLRTRAAADPDRDATHARIRRNRHCRTYADAEGAWHLTARGTAEAGAKFEHALEPIISALFDQARTEGRHEPREAYAFDALMMLAEGEPIPAGGGETRRSSPRFYGLLRLDLAAMVRGYVEGDEICEIAGVGPIPVRVARELLGDAILKLVITKGVDVVNVVHLGRGPTAAQRIALLWMKPKCANKACSSTYTQIDHRIPWRDSKHTTLTELDPLCPHDHKLKTNHGWALADGTGRRAFVGPDDPRHPRNKPPPPDTG